MGPARLGVAIACLAIAGALHAEEPMDVIPEEAAPVAPAGLADEGADRGRFRLAADFLFLKPGVDDTFFVLTSPGIHTTPNGDRQNNDPDYHPGFRVAGGYELPGSGRELELAYTWLGLEQSETVRGPFLTASLGHPDFSSEFESYDGSASADIDLAYHRIDAGLVQPVKISDLDLSLRFGVEFASIRVREDYRYSRTLPDLLGKVGETSRSWGIGPELGLGLDYQLLSGRGFLPGDLSVDMRSSASLLISQVHTHATNEVVGDPPVLDVTDDDTSRIVPAFHTRLGLTYGMPVMGFPASLSVGYQLDTYLGALGQVVYPDDVGDGLADTDTDDFDAQGMYLSVSLGF